MNITKIKRIASLCGALVLLTVCVVSGVKAYHHYQIVAANEVRAEARQVEKQLTPEERAELMVARMTPSQKIGQLMMIGIKGTELDEDAAYMLSEFKIGNVIFYDRNMSTPAQVQNLTAQIQKQVAQNGEIPAFIGVDQEGGRVQRMKQYMPNAPSQRDVSREGTSTAKTWAVTTGKELKNLGINVNFAPVVDLNASSSRSYSVNPATVVSYAQQACEGYESQHVWSCLKHFPGIGKAQVNPHIDGDRVMASYDQLEAEDLRPFRELIRQNDNKAMMVMVSNVTFPALDPEYPGCLSSKIMTDILRKKFGYKGLILTDDMEMGAISKHYSFDQIGVMSIKAGADIVLVCHEYAHEQAVFNGLLKAYNSGELSQKLLDEKVKRIIAVKLSYMEAI